MSPSLLISNGMYFDIGTKIYVYSITTLYFFFLVWLLSLHLPHIYLMSDFSLSLLFPCSTLSARLDKEIRLLTATRIALDLKCGNLNLNLLRLSILFIA
jgi:hypothetical protein